MSNIQGGWRLFGKETVNKGTATSIVGNISSQPTETTSYAAGIPYNRESGFVGDGMDY